MSRLLTIGLMVVGLAVIVGAGTAAEEPEPARPQVRFAPLDVYVDSGGAALAAYQFELTATAGEVTIVGIEGGEHAAFREAPYYDPAALAHDRIVIAAFSTDRILPRGRTRVARVHLQISGDEKPDYSIKLIVAASADGKEIPATVTFKQGEQE